uniref:Uncharacterized protein n=1 Tax=Anguilla anguilla TaxID=7936 RepID=A0A0E9TJ36_ANGAN
MMAVSLDLALCLANMASLEINSALRSAVWMFASSVNSFQNSLLFGELSQ